MTLVLRSIVLGGLLAGFCGVAPLWGQVDEDGDEQRYTALLAVRAVDADAKQITGKTGRDTVIVTVDAKTLFFEHVASKVSEVLDRSVWVLGMVQAPQSYPGSDATTETTVVRILAVVEGDGFQPPPLTESQKNSDRTWMRGEISLRAPGQYVLDDTLMQIGADRPVLRLVARKFSEITEGKRPLLRKGAAVRVAGEKRVEEAAEDSPTRRKKKREPIEVRGARVEMLTKKFAQKDYSIVLGTAP